MMPAATITDRAARERLTGRAWEVAGRVLAVDGFWSKVERGPVDACWTWRGTTGHRGYGYWKSPYFSTPMAHRIAYELVVGPIPAGLVLDHLCRNVLCVNPVHLEPVTIGENVLRGETHTARNRAKTECPKGHPYDEENTWVDRNGWRYCRACKKAQRLARRARSSTSSVAVRGNAAVGEVGRQADSVGDPAALPTPDALEWAWP